jgi:hypothetical protein
MGATELEWIGYAERIRRDVERADEEASAGL